MANKYKKPIGGVPATVLKLLLNIAGAFTKRISHVPSRQVVDGFLDGFSGLIVALSDSDPNDDAQIKGVVNDMLTKGDFYEGTKETIYANINKVKNEPARDALFIVTDYAYIAGDILTDTVEDDGEQLHALLGDFMGSEQGVLFVTALLKTVLDEDTANIIALILLESLKGVVSEDKKAAFNELQTKLQPATA